MIIAYFSDYSNIEQDKQSMQNYVANKTLVLDKTIENHNDHTKPWHQRLLFKLIHENLQPKDQLLIPSAIHLATSEIQLLAILKCINQSEIELHFTNYAKIFASKAPLHTERLLELIDTIQREFISTRTKRGMARRKAQGLPLGRPKGTPNQQLKLDPYRDKIHSWLQQGISRYGIAKRLSCHPQTVYDYVARFQDELNTQI